MKELFGFQKEALEFALSKPKTALFLKMGLGKTLIALNWLKEMSKVSNKLIVITFPAILKTWQREIDNFVFVLNDYNKSKRMIFEKNVINLISIDVFKNLDINEKELVIVLDESQGAKNKSSSRAKKLFKLIPNTKNLLLLSGTPATNGNQDLYPQLKILEIWKSDYKEFLNEFLITEKIKGGNFGFVDIIVGNKNQEKLNELMREQCYFLSNEKIAEFQSLLEKTQPEDHFLDIEWSEAELKALRSKVKNKVFVLESGKEIICDSLIKLMHTNLEYISGALKVKKNFEIQHVKKILTLKYFLLEKNIQKAIIYYNYDSEAFLIKSLLSDLNYTFATKKELSIKKDYQFLLLQYKAGSTGIDGLQKDFNIIFYFSPTYSCEFYLQSKARINRLGQEQKCFYYHLQTKNTLEQKVYNALLSKKSFTKKMFEDNIKDLKGVD